VVGVAVRNAATDENEHLIDWMLHFPARGSVFVNMNAVPQEDGSRVGAIRAGSREFAVLSGSLSERWVAGTSDEEDAPAGHIELVAAYLGELELLDPMEPVE